MITDVQLTAVEGCIRMALQKIGEARKADAVVRKVMENPRLYEPSYVRIAEKTGRFADGQMISALDELKDELAKLPLVALSQATWPAPQPVEGIQS